MGRLVPHGVTDATSDPDTIRRWWESSPYANVGVATGERSGIVVLDIDPRHGGDESLRDEEQRHGELPHTVRSLTGDGTHYWFAHPGHHVGNRTGGVKGFPFGVDLRGDGGYVIAPPSVHVARRRYRWDADASLEDTEFAPLPAWLDEERQPSVHASVVTADAPPLPERIYKGARNAWLASVAGSLRRRGLDADEIFAALSYSNTKRCEPPIADNELREICRSVARYEPQDVPDVGEIETGRPETTPLVPVAFPLTALPSVVQDFAVAVARDLDSVPEIVALPCLIYASGAIGRTRRVRVTARYSESALLWGAIIGDPGVKKTPAIIAAGERLRERDAVMIEQFRKELEDYEWRVRNRVKGQEAPEKPKRKRRVLQDSTIEALAAILSEDSHGVVMDNDELAAWIGSFDQYRARGSGADRAKWLSIWSGHDIRVDRRTREDTLIIRRPFVSVSGAIQPDLLSMLASEVGNDGFLARFCFVNIPRLPAHEIHESTVPFTVVQRWDDTIDYLLTLGGDDALVPFSRAGKEAFIAGSARWAAIQNGPDLDPRLRGFYAKGDGTAARLALILHCIREASGEDQEEDAISPETVQGAWSLMDYFASTMELVVLKIAETEKERIVEALVEFAHNSNGVLTLRLAQRKRVAGIKTASEMKEAFLSVQDHGLGRVERTPHVGGERWKLYVDEDEKEG